MKIKRFDSFLPVECASIRGFVVHGFPNVPRPPQSLSSGNEYCDMYWHQIDISSVYFDSNPVYLDKRYV